MSTWTGSYLRRLDAVLVGPARARRDLVREAADHLEDATDAYLRAGYAPSEAERRAVADFGSLDQVAPAFQTSLAVASARRTTWLLFAVLAVQPFLWDGPIGVFASGAAPDGVLYRVLDTGVEWLGGLMLAASSVLLVATGFGNRYRRAGRGVARLVAGVALGAAVLITGSGIALTMIAGAPVAAHGLLLAMFIVAPMGVVAILAIRTRVAALERH